MILAGSGISHIHWDVPLFMNGWSWATDVVVGSCSSAAVYLIISYLCGLLWMGGVEQLVWLLVPAGVLPFILKMCTVEWWFMSWSSGWLACLASSTWGSRTWGRPTQVMTGPAWGGWPAWPAPHEVVGPGLDLPKLWLGLPGVADLPRQLYMR